MSAVVTPGGAAAPRGLMTVLFAGVFLAALDTAVVAPVIPALREAFALDHRAAGLVTTVFILFALPATALMASLGDRHGRRPVYLACITIFALGSLVVAVAPSYWGIQLGRAIQGVGGGGILPVASAVIGDALPPAGRGRALGLVGATYGMAFVLGPPLAALAMVLASWRWIFLANLPIAAAVLLLGLRTLPRRSAPAQPGRLDWPGIVVVFTLLGALVLGLTQVADAWSGARLWPALLLAALVLVPLLAVIERRAAAPLVPPALLARRQLVLAYLLALGAGIGMGAVMYLTSLAQLVHGVSEAHGGFALLPLVLCSMIGSMLSGRQLHRLGARTVTLAGFALLAVGYGASAWTGWGLVGFLVATMPAGLGIGVVVGGALRGIAIDESPPALRGAAQGLVNIATSIGTLLAVSGIGALADWAGGGAHGFGVAYAAVAGVMAAMWLLALALARHEPARDTAAALP